MDLKLKLAAAVTWTGGAISIVLVAFDHALWLLLLGIAFFAGAVCWTLCAAARSCARGTRRAVYHQRRWDDTPDAQVLQLLRADDDDNRPRQAGGSIRR